MYKVNLPLWLSAALFAVVSVVYIAHLRNRNAALSDEKQALIEQNETLATQYELTNEAYQALSAKRLQIRTQTRTVIKRIKTAPAGDDAPVAPVLKQALEAL